MNKRSSSKKPSSKKDTVKAKNKKQPLNSSTETFPDNGNNDIERKAQEKVRIENIERGTHELNIHFYKQVYNQLLKGFNGRSNGKRFEKFLDGEIDRVADYIENDGPCDFYKEAVLNGTKGMYIENFETFYTEFRFDLKLNFKKVSGGGEAPTDKTTVYITKAFFQYQEHLEILKEESEDLEQHHTETLTIGGLSLLLHESGVVSFLHSKMNSPKGSTFMGEILHQITNQKASTLKRNVNLLSQFSLAGSAEKNGLRSVKNLESVRDILKRVGLNEDAERLDDEIRKYN